MVGNLAALAHIILLSPGTLSVGGVLSTGGFASGQWSAQVPGVSEDFYSTKLHKPAECRYPRGRSESQFCCAVPTLG